MLARASASFTAGPPPGEKRPLGGQRPHAVGKRGGLIYSKPSSWILRVIVLRPIPSFWAASIRRPLVLDKAARIRRDSKRWVSASHTLVLPAPSKAMAS